MHSIDVKLLYKTDGLHLVFYAAPGFALYTFLQIDLDKKEEEEEEGEKKENLQTVKTCQRF